MQYGWTTIEQADGTYTWNVRKAWTDTVLLDGIAATEALADTAAQRAIDCLETCAAYSNTSARCARCMVTGAGC